MDGRRPVILVLRVGNEGVTPLDGDDESRDQHGDDQRRERERHPHPAHVQRDFRMHRLRRAERLGRPEKERSVSADGQRRDDPCPVPPEHERDDDNLDEIEDAGRIQDAARLPQQPGEEQDVGTDQQASRSADGCRPRRSNAPDEPDIRHGAQRQKCNHGRQRCRDLERTSACQHRTGARQEVRPAHGNQPGQPNRIRCGPAGCHRRGERGSSQRHHSATG